MGLSSRFGSILAVGNTENHVHVYAVGSVDPLLVLSGPTGAQNATRIFFDPTEEYLVVIYQSGHICVWDLVQEELVRAWVIQGSVLAAAMHPIGNVLALLRPRSIELWNVQLKTLIHNYVIPESKYTAPSSILFTPDGLNLVCGASYEAKAAVLVFNLERGSLTHTLVDPSDTQAHVTSLAFHPNELLLATGSSSGKVALYEFNLASLAPAQSHISPSATAINQLLWPAPGSCLLALSSTQLTVWSTPSGAVQYVDALGFLEASQRNISFGFGHYAIIVSSTSGSTMATSFFNLQNFGLFMAPFPPQTPEDTKESPLSASSNQVEDPAIDDDSLISSWSDNMLVLKLRTRLDYLKSLRAAWSGKSNPSILSALSKQASAAKPELLSELMTYNIVESALNIDVSTVGSTGLSLQSSEELNHLVAALKATLKTLPESKQLAALDYLESIIPPLSTTYLDKFALLKEVLSKMAEADTPVGIRAGRIESLM